MKQVSLLLLLIGQFSVGAQELDGTINGTVHLLTKENRIKVDLNYKVLNKEDTAKSVRFFLTTGSTLHDVSGPQVEKYFIDTTTRPERTVVILLKQGAQNNKPIIRFQYELDYDTARYRKYGFIELGLDWFWFPVHPRIGDWNLNYQLLVKTDEPILDLYSNGDVSKATGGAFKVVSIYPDFDIDLFFFKNSSVYNGGNNDLKIVGDRSNPKLMDSIANATAKYLNFYRNAFGKTSSKVTAVFRPHFIDPNAFGYSRQGYFVLSIPKNLNAVQLYLAHEIAHFWFRHGEATENAWLTESFAEFGAMLAIKRFQGDSSYQALIKDKQARLERFKKEGKTIPAVYKNGSRNKNILSQVALYHKGPLVLDQILQSIGEAKMVRLMKLAFERKIKTSDDFLNLVGEITSQKVKAEAKALVMNF